jgi:hypothetical protein
VGPVRRQRAPHPRAQAPQRAPVERRRTGRPRPPVVAEHVEHEIGVLRAVEVLRSPAGAAGPVLEPVGRAEVAGRSADLGQVERPVAVVREPGACRTGHRGGGLAGGEVPHRIPVGRRPVDLAHESGELERIVAPQQGGVAGHGCVGRVEIGVEVDLVEPDRRVPVERPARDPRDPVHDQRDGQRVESQLLAGAEGVGQRLRDTGVGDPSHPADRPVDPVLPSGHVPLRVAPPAPVLGERRRVQEPVDDRPRPLVLPRLSLVAGQGGEGVHGEHLGVVLDLQRHVVPLRTPRAAHAGHDPVGDLPVSGRGERGGRRRCPAGRRGQAVIRFGIRHARSQPHRHRQAGHHPHASHHSWGGYRRYLSLPDVNRSRRAR